MASLRVSSPDGFVSGPFPFVFVGSSSEWLGDPADPGMSAQRVCLELPVSLGSSLVHISSQALSPGVYRGQGEPRVRCFEQGGEAATENGQPDSYLSIRLSRRKLSMGTSECRLSNGGRGVVTAFSEGASARLGRYAEECKAVYPFMGTLTVDGEYSSDPADFRAAKDRFLTWFMRRMRALCPSGDVGLQSILWWVEFQRRGAPHLHFFYTTRVPFQEAAMKWQSICHRFGLARADNHDFWRSATKFETVRCGWRGVAGYARKYARKQDQKVPLREVYDWRGRFWGVRGYSETEFVKITRTTDEHWREPGVYPAWVELQGLMESAVEQGRARRCKWPSPGSGVSYFPCGGWERQTRLRERVDDLLALIARGASFAG